MKISKSLLKLLLIVCCTFATVSFADSNIATILKHRLYHVAPNDIKCTQQIHCKSGLLLAEFYTKNNYTPIWIKDGQLTQSGLELINILRHAYQDGLDPRAYHIKQIAALTASINDTANTSNNNLESNPILANIIENQTHTSASTTIVSNHSTSNNIKKQDISLMHEPLEESGLSINDKKTLPPINPHLLASLELTLSDAFLLYADNLYYSQIDIKKMYPDWNDVKAKINLLEHLSAAAKNPTTTVANLAPKYQLYGKLKSKLHDYQAVALHDGWNTIPAAESLRIGDSGHRVALLRRRLFISGELSTIGGNKFDTELKHAVMQYQDNNGLYDDGVVDSDTLAALNVSVKTRIRQIELNMDKIRLLPQEMPSDYIMVNLPAYSLQAVTATQPPLSIEIAVGGTQHPSCVLNSAINYLVLNPYWNIPPSIAESEIWPSIKKDPHFLSTKYVQVLAKNKHGTYVPIDPSRINWRHLSPRQFNSYRYRQSPGTLNALGKVKFIFPNSCDIYLHDSNESEVFDVYARAFSHGCVRLSQPLNLTTYVLTNEKNWSSNKIANMFQNSIDKVVTMPKPLPIYIMYFTAWVSDDDWLQFGVDIYNLDDLSRYHIFLPKKLN